MRSINPCNAELYGHVQAMQSGDSMDRADPLVWRHSSADADEQLQTRKAQLGEENVEFEGIWGCDAGLESVFDKTQLSLVALCAVLLVTRKRAQGRHDTVIRIAKGDMPSLSGSTKAAPPMSVQFQVCCRDTCISCSRHGQPSLLIAVHAHGVHSSWHDVMHALVLA